MGKYDNQVKQVYSTYHPANVSETYTIYEINDLAFNALEQIIHEYRLRYVDKNTVINYLNLIETAENPQEMLNEIRAILFNSVASDNYMIMSPKVGKSRLRQLSNACSLTTEYSL